MADSKVTDRKRDLKMFLDFFEQFGILHIPNYMLSSLVTYQTARCVAVIRIVKHMQL